VFIELHAQSAFSFLEGAEHPEAFAAEAARLDMPAIALVDRDGVYGAARLARAATKAGVKPIVGSEITLADGSRLPLLVEDREGYQNLCRLITRMKLGAPKGSAALALDDLEPSTAGLVCLTGGARGPLAQRLAARDDDGARQILDRLVALFGRSSCFVEVQRQYSRAQEQMLQRLVTLARAAHVPLIASNQPLFARPEGRPLADVFTCIREKTDLDHAGRRLLANGERSLKSAGAMTELFRDLPDALDNTGELALRLAFTLKDLGYRFPEFPLPPGQSPLGYLRELTERGVRTRYGEGTLAARARRQVAHELELIGRLDLAGYFLIVWDIVEHCRTHDILVQGRGSAANSAVCYALGITAVDPVGMELLFERFLSEARGEWPDIDLDLPSGERREAVIQHVYQRYGRLGAGMTANVITYRGRSAAREVGQALGLPSDMRDRLAKLVANWGYQDPEELLTKHLPEAGCDPTSPRIRRFATLWTRIQDLPRHLGQHSGGMVIAAGRLDDVVPLEPATMPGRVVVQWDKDDCAGLGIVKVDLLGLGMMSVLQDSLTLVRETGGAVDLAQLPPDDPAVYRSLQEADTIGVFQVESRAQMATLPRVRPERFYDLVVQVAIIRPGPIVGDMVHPYIRRRRGREPVTYPHPSLEPILRRTLGVPLFQEQLLKMAMVTAGFTATEAEELRRAFGFKRSERLMAEVETKLRAGMARQGIHGAAAEEIVHAITAFALYGFPECVVGETRVLDADTGRWEAIEDIVSRRVCVESTLACDANMRLRKRRVLAATPSGRRIVFRVRTALGRELMATAEHPLLTMSGWRALGSLRAGDHVAAARALPAPGRRRWPRHQLIVLADLIAEGNLCRANARAKRFPAEVFELCAPDLALLLARLWEGDGSLSSSNHASYDTVSRRLAEEIQHLLLRLGIVSRLYARSHRYRERRVGSFVVTITGQENLKLFYRRIARRFLDRRKRLRARVLVREGAQRRASRDVVPVAVKALIDRERRHRSVTWNAVGDGSPDTSKRGYRRWVIGRLARYFDSPELARLAESDLYWDRVVSIDPIGARETYDLHIEGDHNFLANDLVVHNSHASSFALLAYASAYLRVHHSAAFYAALLNNQPMGFYHPATIVKDAQRHGLRILPIDVTRSQWLCTIEPTDRDGSAMRMGLRYVKGMRERAARAIVEAREARAFGSIHDLARRAQLDRDELETLAAIGALAPLGGTRRTNLWAAAMPHPGPLFVDPPREPSPLSEMTDVERLAADYAGTSVTLGRHPMALRRAALRAGGVLSARELSGVEDGARVRVAGSVIVRQRPGTAKGFVFLSLEDETGIANVIVTPPIFARHRLALVSEPYLLVDGIAQRQDGVISVRAIRARGLPALGHHVPSHDFG
jgi:error-prone DNA polymerase